ncbi:translation initiation factor eIF3 subunit [Basidiobolus meristosporus CBS 931.73]|uniref:Eukaryotic translation initiation factor 3 subunit J n=1 Tax=Basidiobolus meristosporus CBS 931.73 TaxID=1314790 RepID=A0A1Y1YA81_9FUNG|nr:translation initiation factor eIF3 subunit [Basidiobolus meristosporus CBS 931.73]|eukprot:ORX94863.1 translation initiation factor eIF3 subunit [Basidiobolus meristosporus CBS 931.73]
MSDWEKEDFDEVPAVVVAKTGKFWDDEDEDSDGVKDNWDDSDSEAEEEEEKKAAPVAAPAKPKKIPLAEKIRMRQEEEEKRKQQIAEKKAAMAGDEDAAARRARLQALEVEADIENATDLFSGVSVKDTEVGNKLTRLQPKTKEEFDEFSTVLLERINSTSKQVRPTVYMGFLEGFVRELASPLKDVEVRKLASILTTLANEKQRAAKDAAKGKKKTKKTTATIKQVDAIDTTDYSRNLDDDFDDFM